MNQLFGKLYNSVAIKYSSRTTTITLMTYTLLVTTRQTTLGTSADDTAVLASNNAAELPQFTSKLAQEVAYKN